MSGQKSKSTVPKSTVPKSTVPKSTVSKSTVPKSTVPKSTVPKSTVPKSTVPKSTVSKSTVSKSTVPKPTVDYVKKRKEKTFVDENNDQQEKLMMLVDFINENAEAAFVIQYKNYGFNKVYNEDLAKDNQFPMSKKTVRNLP
ncbi:unnamed protein product [Rotaria socialis]